MSEFQEIDGFQIEYFNSESENIISITYGSQKIKRGQKVELSEVLRKGSSFIPKGTLGLIVDLLLLTAGTKDPIDRIGIQVHFEGQPFSVFTKLKSLVI